MNNNHCTSYTGGRIGNFGNESSAEVERKHTIVQSLWTKPITDYKRLRETLFLAALSLEYAHRSGYKVNMHTDSLGIRLLRNFGYDKLCSTLANIPSSVPVDLFAAGKFYAMRAEGIGKVHVDIDVLLKKPGILDRFYTNRYIDCICQMEEDMPQVSHTNIITSMFQLGYPAATRPNWNGSMNTGVVGFNNPILAARYMNNYFDALKMYTKDVFDKYKAENPGAWMAFDFILEQVNLSCMSVGYNACTLLPTKEPSIIADKIGYQHLQGFYKWSDQPIIKRELQRLNPELYMKVIRNFAFIE